MNLVNLNILDEAQGLIGCLSNQKTTKSYRRYDDKEDVLDLPDDFAADEAKILSSKAFRVMSDKTQVFTLPHNALVRNRQKHVHEVVAISVVTSEMLGLNTNLVRAAALGHDIGHVPFGHQGEAWMAKAMNQPTFCHEVMGPIVCQSIERRGRGLNLTWHTLEAMMCHSGDTAHEGMSQEAWVLRHTDKFAYLFHDYNDIGTRMEYPFPQEIVDLVNSFGANQRERTTTAICGLVIESARNNKVSFEVSELGRKFQRLRKLMYKVYPCVTQQDVDQNMSEVLKFLTMLNIGDPFLLLALMTDRDMATILSASPMKDAGVLKQTSLKEITPYLKDIGQINLCDPDLDWKTI